MSSWQVVASADDALRRLSDAVWTLTVDEERAGGSNINWQSGSGMRFINITIPKGATITAAYLTLRCASNSSGTVVRTRISAEDIDDAPTFADDADAFDTRWAARTTARVDWDAIPAWTLNTDYNSPDISAVIQEIIDRAGWVSGNNLVIFWEDFDDRTSHVVGGDRRAWSYDALNAFAPKLVIEWTLGVKMVSEDSGKLVSEDGIKLISEDGIKFTQEAIGKIVSEVGARFISEGNNKMVSEDGIKFTQEDSAKMINEDGIKQVSEDSGKMVSEIGGKLITEV